MRNLCSRLVTFGDASVHLEYTSGRAADIVAFLFSGLRDDDAILPHVNIRLAEQPNDGLFTIYVAGEARFRNHEPGAVATWLVHATCRELARENRTGLVLHSAAVTVDHACLLLPGPIGSGKTTLVAFLSTRGFDYLTDELVFIPLGNTEAEACARPLKIKRSGLRVLERYLQAGGAREPSLESPTEVLELLPAAGDSWSSRRRPLAAIVFPRYDKDSAFHLEPQSAARSGLRLMECLLNARNLQDHGFDEVVRLARIVPSYSLSYGNLEQLEENVEALRRIAASRQQLPRALDLSGLV